jgi:hypothetical protein
MNATAILEKLGKLTGAAAGTPEQRACYRSGLVHTITTAAERLRTVDNALPEVVKLTLIRTKITFITCKIYVYTPRRKVQLAKLHRRVQTTYRSRCEQTGQRVQNRAVRKMRADGAARMNIGQR